MIRHAIVGCGRVAPNHADGFGALTHGELAWACDRDLATARAFAAAHGVGAATDSVERVLRDPSVTSVSVAVDHAGHHRLAARALLAGKHVLVEKPLALSKEDGEQLVKLAEERGLVLSVVSQHRYDPLVVAVRRWVGQGLLGTLLYAQVSLEASRTADYYSDSYWRGTWAGEGGSALVNQGYHCLDVTRSLLGPLEVRAAIAGRARLGEVIETEDTLSALLLAGATPVTLNVTVGSATLWRTRLELVGSAGSVCLDLDHPSTLHRATGAVATVEHPAETMEPAPGIGYYGVSHRRQIANFAAAITSGEPLVADARSGVGMVELLQQIYRATGRGPQA
ncbi:Gfo/Idh/MocA family protein [Nonomuraea sp. SBT364]|uniref:Gfo/Idh/MocA family protein n=1 Tax=Nonomuraea sp. SBT364 TaxID=1580530 RepID=UPI00066A47AC|nr:Gfo/Idh/MocA family oxidoreductase [Nonomuraea sp. SBT364]